MSRKNENTDFLCAHCGKSVLALTNGSYRNHCPYCFYSLHVDNIPGDRQSQCGGLMKPVDVRLSSKKGYQLIHRCETCGTIKVNRVAFDTVMPDDLDQIIHIMNRRTKP